ncbi:hypothetical protein N7505_007747 [Penicillium chrysogenum]|uniref:Uncharacterized protein n=1 Tax=Penicillium chrysogenum TaxID=5076 RepID=A0ABQ8WH74_PENCH|nr:hypothetical protein N7505_007747 [Penicillium chrysogenum]
MLPRTRMGPCQIHATIVVSNTSILGPLPKPHLQGGQALITMLMESINHTSDMGCKSSLRPPTNEDEEMMAGAHAPHAKR